METTPALTPLSTTEEIKELELTYNKEIYGTHGASVDTTFAFAFILARSPFRDDVALALRLFNDLTQSAPERRNELKFLMAASAFRLKQYSSAKAHLSQMIREGGEQRQAVALAGQIERAMLRDGVTGMALVGGAVAVAAVAAWGLLRRR